MQRLIDANALEPDTEWDEYYDGFLSYSQSQIDAAPTIEAEPVRRGQLYEDKPLTNGDRIRAMTDEELAESLSGYAPCKHIMSCLDTSCYECTLKWLKQEAQEVSEDAGVN